MVSLVSSQRGGLAPLFIGAFACVIGTGGASASEAPRGQSAELGISFSARGGVKWCAPDIDVALTARRRGAFELNNTDFAQMVSRIRAVIQSQCPKVERIKFFGTIDGKIDTTFEVTRLAAWRRLVAIDNATRLPSCKATSLPIADDTCKAFAKTYAAAHRLFRGPQFEGIVLDLDTGAARARGAIIWRVENIVGRIAPVDDLVTGKTDLAMLQNALVTAAIEACTSSGGQPEALETKVPKSGAKINVVRCNHLHAKMDTAQIVALHRYRGRASSISATAKTTDERITLAVIVAGLALFD